MIDIMSFILHSKPHSFYSFLCTCSFPDKKKAEEDDLGGSMEASNRVKLVR